MRPAGYEHIPDVQATGAEIIAIVSLVIGLASTALSFFLQPKPAGELSKAGGSRTLASRSGADRFAQTTGFDSTAELAQYGEAVPIVWTRWTGTTGGVLVSPKLVWSRMFSRGSQQGIKLLYVVGESGVSAPDLAGVYLGNNGLNVVSPRNYALWWNGNGKPTRSNLLYGTQGSRSAGDPQAGGGALFNTSAGDESFSQALSPSNSTQFGVSNGVPNGTQYRVNYRIVSIPKQVAGKNALFRERMKVCGRLYIETDDKLLKFPHDGVGYAYFRRQGIGGQGIKGLINVSPGSTITYVISGNYIDKFFWGNDEAKSGGGLLDDVNNTLDSECAAADDILQNGETVMINGSLWRVTDRSLPAWTKGATQRITLECVEVISSNEVRVLSESQITSTAGNTPGLPGLDVSMGAGLTYDNLCRATVATIKNTRACQFSEIGIRSQVWGRFNGLCNFNSLYSANQIRALDRDGISVQSGTMSDYFTRTSVFTLHYRVVGQSTWIRTNVNFCIRGSSPVDQFNAISVRHDGLQALEFRIVPLTAAAVGRLGNTHQLQWLNSTSEAQDINAGGITIRAQVQAISVEQCGLLEMMIATDENNRRRVFEERTGLAEISFYGGLINRSCDSGPEHQIVYLNELVALDQPSSFASLSTVGFAARSGRNLNNIDQLRLWIDSGINNSNSFPDLVLYLLRRVNGISNQLINESSFDDAAAYCESRGLLFDGVIADRSNLRQYIADTAPFFLLNFVIANGKFALMPALTSNNPPISNLFTAGNIIEGSFNVEYLPADQRRDFQALVTYRKHVSKNEIPILKTCRVRYNDVPDSAPIETFDISSFCTNRDHAIQVARFFLSLRRRVTHAIKFKIAPEGAGIAPGSYIKVALQQVVADSYGNGVISAIDGQVTSATPLADGTYAITYYQPGTEGVQTGNLTIANGVTANTQLWGALFTLTSSTINTGTYLVEQIDLDEDGLVNVTATEYPASAINSDMAGNGMTLEET